MKFGTKNILHLWESNHYFYTNKCLHIFENTITTNYNEIIDGYDTY